MDLVDVRFEEGLPTAAMFDSATRDVIIIEDLMAETDERVTILFTKKVITITRPCCISYRICSLKQGESYHQPELSLHGGVQESS